LQGWSPLGVAEAEWPTTRPPLPQTAAVGPGASCAYGQSGAVLFLANTWGGAAVRDACMVPSGKAIFFPILNFFFSDTGVAPSMQLSDAELMETVNGELDGVPVSGLSAV
jgi:hypothetical protein